MSNKPTYEELEQKVRELEKEALDRKQAEEAAKIAHAELNQIFQTAADGMIVIDKNFNVIRVNETFSNLSGISQHEAVGEKCYDIFPGQLCHTPGCPMVRISDGVERLEYEVEKQHKDGTKIFSIVTATPFRGPDGELVGIVENFKDITMLKRAEEELQHSLKNLRKAMRGIIKAMALTVETRDPYTAGHQERVADLARSIAKEMRLSKKQIEGIRMAGVIHDLGKISVPAEILSKPGRLTEIEFSLIKTHSRVGYDILKTIDFPWPVAQMVLQHHERMDGSGYPQGLSGEKIMMESRILAVADVVEAMSSHRPYRPALGIDKALAEISEKRGVLYDPDGVDACLKLFAEKRFEFKSEKEKATVK